MADEPRYADEIRIPITMTLPWSGKLTREGKPWPRDARGRDWPEYRGRPEFPIDQLPHGFAPGTNAIYRPGDGRRITDQFAAMDAAMMAELRRVAAAGRRSGGGTTGPAGQPAIHRVADPEEEEERKEEKSEERLIPHLPGTRPRAEPLDDSTPIRDAVPSLPLSGGAAVLKEDRGSEHVISPQVSGSITEGPSASEDTPATAGEPPSASHLTATRAEGPQRLSFGRTEAEYESLAKDPSRGGGMDDKSEQERKVGLDLESRGLLPGRITRDPTGRAEFVDRNGQKWDVKAFNSNYPQRKGGFALKRDADVVEKSLGKNENVIVDTSNINPNDLAALKLEGAARNWGNRVIYWP